MAPLHPTCPTDDMLGALVHRALAPDELAQVTAHLDVCAVCQQIVLATVRGRRSTQRTVPMAAFSPESGLRTGTYAAAEPAHSGSPGSRLLAIFDGRGMPPAVSAAAWQRGPIDGRGMPPAVSAAAWQRGSIDRGANAGAAADALPDIPRYTLRGVLGSGGMGTVYDAYDRELGRSVALKVLRPELSAAPGLADRLVRESRLMAKIAHPSVITVYDVGRAHPDGRVCTDEAARPSGSIDGGGREGAVFIAMEQIQGSTLTAWLAEHALAWRDILALFERAGQGLAAAHSAGIVHRDFKPDNVLVSRDGQRVVVTDFGIAREADPPIERLAFGSTQRPRAVPHIASEIPLVGTPAYMAPEQVSGLSVDPRADVYAFSVALWEAVFRGRPFPGANAPEIFAAMQRAPARAHRVRVPRRLVRALRRGLALDPRDRWPDMPALLAELAAIRSFRGRAALPLAAAGFVALGVTAVLVVARDAPAIDPCAGGLAALDAAYTPALADRVAAALAGEPQIRDDVRARLTATAAVWRTTHRATCRADREFAQDARTTACLEARRLELTAAIDDVITGGPAGARYATRISRLPGDPAACATPAPGLLFARVPADPAARRTVTALRNRLADADLARDRADFPRALAIANEAAAAAATAWPPVLAEAQLTLGRIQRLGGDSEQATAILRDATVAAERSHSDDVLVHSWIQLAFASAFAEGDTSRALEYVSYAEAAADRIGRPQDIMVHVHQIKGTVLAAMNRTTEGETELHLAVELAEATQSDQLARVLQGLGLLYENQGRYADAVASYRKAIEHLPRSPSGEVIGSPTYFERLAINLSHIGQPEQAEREARRAVDMAQRTLPDGQIARWSPHVQLALILQDAGRFSEALTEITKAVGAFEQIGGTRSARYGTVLGMQAAILTEMARFADAARLQARACEIEAFNSSETSPEYASCEVLLGTALIGMHRNSEALATLDHAVANLNKDDGGNPTQVADALRMRGTAHAALAHQRAAIDDFERAIAIFQTSTIEPGYLADTKWKLGLAVWPGQPARARAEVREAAELFGKAARMWSRQRETVATWLTRHDPVQQRR